MEQLRQALHLDWEYVDALDKDDVQVERIMDRVRLQRALPNVSFQWPDDSAVYAKPLAVTEMESWPFPWSTKNLNDTTISGMDSGQDEPLTCAIDDDLIPTYTDLSAVPFHLILSRGMVACWYSHISVIRKIADNGHQWTKQREEWDGKEGVAIVFEDDIDVERDLHARLAGMWGDLPRNWDIVFLGTCHTYSR